MQEFIINIMNQFGYFGIMFLIAVENVFPPIPSEVILTFGGFMTTYSEKITPVGVIIFATIGSVVGAVILYGIGRCFTEETLERWISGKWARILGFKQGDVTKTIEWFDRRGKITVLFCRCIPIIRSLISIPAGVAKMKLSLFFLYTVVGSLAWNILLVYLGVAAGESWVRIAEYFNTYSHITLIVLGVVAVIVAGVFLKIRHTSNAKKN